ncbi:MAG: ABC transporter permease subunit, partial [Candidatus Hydrothermarchaeaceae archaeon]
AARSLGSSSWRALRLVTAPLVRPGLLTGAALVFLTTMKELPATLLLAPTGFNTLATRVWSATDNAFFARAAAPALLLVGVSTLSMVIILSQERRGEEANQ